MEETIPANTRVLVVEDERVVALAIKHCLQSLGHVVPATVATGEEAIRKAAEVDPDLILMDIRLGGEIDGVEAAEKINRTFKIPVIYLTAYSDEKTLSRARVTEPMGYILKPFDENTIKSTIEMALYRSAIQERHRTTNEKKRLQKLLEVSNALERINDLDSVLDRILLEARSFTNADSGTIYLVEGSNLRFAYNSQSGTLLSGDPNRNSSLYLNHCIPIDEHSIAGHVGLTGEPLIVDDAYNIDPGVPYAFNPTFDRENNYQTVSMLTIPLKTAHDATVGVLQLINALDRRTLLPIPFLEEDQLYVSLFAKDAAVAVERASMTRTIILRMIKMAELRDPKETGAHVNRVGAYSIEIYQRWAEKRNIPSDEIKRTKDVLRLGAMMHDVGKIAIADAILKKPGRLTDEERATMQEHTVIGARLFRGKKSQLDEISEEIALNHHERWDGVGYPGELDDIYEEPIELATGKKGEEIPLFGRIVGLADVYDALCSRRAYKEPWDQNRVIETIREESGKHFDPDVVEAFAEITEVIQAIRAKYNE